MRKTFFFFLIFALFISVFRFVYAQEQIEIRFFYTETCPHCQKEKAFLENLEQKYCQIKLEKLNVVLPENKTLLKKLYDEYSVDENVKGYVPITFIDKIYFFGYDSDETTGKKLEDYITTVIKNNGQCPEKNWQDQWPATPIDLDRKINLPIFGEIKISELSPLALAVVLGSLDGFNACAMTALMFLLTALVSTGIRERVVLIGGTFILVSGIVYFLFISAWFNLFLVLEQIKFITLFIGVVIIIFSVFLLKDYFHGVICKLCEVRLRKSGKENIFIKLEKKLFLQMQKASKSSAALPVVILTVAGVAAGINAVELVCSFGFPLVFTKILSGFKLSALSYYFFLLVYIIFYMMDDFIIFLLAVWTLKMTKISQKYLGTVKLISGIVLLLLGIALILKPEILSFG